MMLAALKILSSVSETKIDKTLVNERTNVNMVFFSSRF